MADQARVDRLRPFIEAILDGKVKGVRIDSDPDGSRVKLSMKFHPLKMRVAFGWQPAEGLVQNEVEMFVEGRAQQDGALLDALEFHHREGK